MSRTIRTEAITTRQSHKTCKPTKLAKRVKQDVNVANRRLRKVDAFDETFDGRTRSYVLYHNDLRFG